MIKMDFNYLLLGFFIFCSWLGIMFLSYYSYSSVEILIVQFSVACCWLVSFVVFKKIILKGVGR